MSRDGRDLEDRVKRLENYFVVAAIVTAVLGISGAWLMSQISGANTRARQAIELATTAETRLKVAMEKAEGEIGKASEAAVAVEAAEALRDLPARFTIAFGSEAMID